MIRQIQDDMLQLPAPRTLDLNPSAGRRAGIKKPMMADWAIDNLIHLKSLLIRTYVLNTSYQIRLEMSSSRITKDIIVSEVKKERNLSTFSHSYERCYFYCRNMH